MTIPTASNFPTAYDTNDNLFLVHDGLRVRLLEDYSPGDTTIYIEGDSEVISRFPDTGLITLTEQVSDIEERALSFYYGSRTETTFDELELLSGFTDTYKPKRVTNVTQNVMSSHHNNIKDAVIAIEEFIGISGTIDTEPLGDTMTGRINFLRKLVLTPRAWFTSDKTAGIVPLTVAFTDKSFRLGDGDVTFVWDFGDSTTSNVSYISVISAVPSDLVDVLVVDTDGGNVIKTYETPGIYDVSLKVTNSYGTDTVLLKNYITAKIEAPKEATITFTPTSTQIASSGDDPPVFDRLDGYPVNSYTIPPTIRSGINTFIYAQVPVGENPINPGYSYGGEKLRPSTILPIDPIETYTWSFGDDLIHANSMQAKASYSIGGVYDMKLRVDTTYGAFRITTYKNVIDIIEKRNLWLFHEDGGDIKANEFGLISETFKVATNTYSVTQDDSFLDGTGEETRAKSEFARNITFVAESTTYSGDLGNSLIFWSEGGSPLSAQTMGCVRYNGFADTYSLPTIMPSSTSLDRPWNWIAFHTGSKSYFLFGPDPSAIPYTNLSNQSLSVLDLTTMAVTTTAFTPSDYKGSATELQQHITAGYDGSGEPTSGRYAVYRSAWKDSAGYILRNEATGSFFRIKSFYKVDGTLSDPVTSFSKLSDMPGNPRTEGQLVTMSNGLFFFNNSGNIVAYNDASGTWETGSSNSTSFKSLQDSSVSGFDNESNTLLASSDGNRMAYLSFDYSENAVIKFNGVDLTFSLMPSRPYQEQWTMGVY